MELKSHRAIQELLLNKIIRFLGYVIFPVLLINLSRFFILGWLFSFNYYIVAALVIFVIAINVTKLPYLFKVYFLIFLFFSLAISTGLNFGMVSFMTEFLIITIFVSVIFLPQKQAYTVSFLCGISLVFCAVLNIRGVLPLVKDFEKHINSIPSWASFVIVFLFMAGVVILIAGDIGNLLAGKITALEKKNADLIKANEEVRKLQGILPICSCCKKVRDDQGYWLQVESYIEDHSGAQFSHGLCDECYDKLYRNEKWFIKNKMADKNK